MSEDFIDHVIQAGCNSCCDHDGQPDENAREYEQQKETFNRLFDEIEGKLGGEYKLMRRFEEILNSLYGMEEERIYRKGFHDCMQLLKWMNAFN